MIDMNIPKMRERKKDRQKSSAAFFLKVHDTVTNIEA